MWILRIHLIRQANQYQTLRPSQISNTPQIVMYWQSCLRVMKSKKLLVKSFSLMNEWLRGNHNLLLNISLSTKKKTSELLIPHYSVLSSWHNQTSIFPLCHRSINKQINSYLERSNLARFSQILFNRAWIFIKFYVIRFLFHCKTLFSLPFSFRLLLMKCKIVFLAIHLCMFISG